MKYYRTYTIPTSSFSKSACIKGKKLKMTERFFYPIKSATHKVFTLLTTLFLSTLLMSCASENLKAPCPNYGKHCNTTPVNSWDTTTV